MKRLFSLIMTVAAMLGVLLAHIMVGYMLPPPFNQINLLFLALLLYSLYRSEQVVLWAGVIVGFLSELFSSSPFGINSVSIVVSLTLLSWLLRNIFINHSWYVVLLSGFLYIVSYRLVYFFLIMVLGIFTGDRSISNNLSLWSTAEEAAINALVLTIIYFFISLVSKHKLSPKYISI